MKDFPAAHSMDSTWFAVDEAGEVAYFESGEAGSIPAEGFPTGGEADDVTGALDEPGLLSAGLWARARSDSRLRDLLPASFAELTRRVENSAAWEHIVPLIQSVGIWIYSNELVVAAPYARHGKVAAPLRVGDLDEQTRQHFASVRLPLRFSESPMIAPGEHMEVDAWDPVWFDTQGRPQPIVGRDEEYRRVGAQLQSMLPDEVLPDVGSERVTSLDGDEFYLAVREVLEKQFDDDATSDHSARGCLGFLFSR